MKRLVVIFSFLFFFLFLFPALSREGLGVGFVLAQPVATASASTQPSWWDSFWAWIDGIFIKNDYSVSQRSPDEIIYDQNNYSIASNSSKHSSQGTRLTDAASQTCYKGCVIEKVALGESGYSDDNISYICSDSLGNCTVSTKSDSNCEAISIKKLAKYLIQMNQKFYCNDQHNLINIEANVFNAIISSSLPEIPNNNLNCYQKIYQDFYLIPKGTNECQKQNSQNIVKTPISAKDQKPNSNNNEYKDQLDQNISPKGTSAGLDGLRYAGQ